MRGGKGWPRQLPTILIRGKSKRKTDTTGTGDTLANYVKFNVGRGGYTQLTLKGSKWKVAEYTVCQS